MVRNVAAYEGDGRGVHLTFPCVQPHRQPQSGWPTVHATSILVQSHEIIKGLEETISTYTNWTDFRSYTDLYLAYESSRLSLLLEALAGLCWAYQLVFQSHESLDKFAHWRFL